MRELGWLVIVMLVFTMFGCEPAAPKFEYKEKRILTGLQPYGIAFHEGSIHISSPDENLIAVLNDEFLPASMINDYEGPRRLNTTAEQLIIAEFETNRVVLRKGNQSFYYPLVQRLNGPMACDMVKSVLTVADYNAHRIVFFEGSEDKSFGDQGSGEKEFHYPTDVQIHGQKIYVADNANKRVQVYDLEGRLVKSISHPEMVQASGLFVFGGGVIVCDRKGQQVFHFNHAGEVLQIMNEGFETPSDAIIVDNTLYVTDQADNGLAILHWK